MQKGVLVSNLALLFALAIFLPIYIYLQEGLETVYHNLLHYHPHVLHLDHPQYSRYFVVALFIFSGKLYIQVPLLRRFAGPKFSIGFRKLLTAAFIFVTLFLAFLTMTIVAITQSLPPGNTNEILLDFIRMKSSPLIYLLVVIVIYVLSQLAMVNKYFELYKQIEIFRSASDSIFLNLLFFSVIFGVAAVLFIHSVSLITIYFYSGTIIFLVALLHLFINQIIVIKFKKV